MVLQCDDKGDEKGVIIVCVFRILFVVEYRYNYNFIFLTLKYIEV
ncbi:MAG: hypothetical protein JWP71_256 [Mucilaginibacter sp.]|nr:hypothetical protein [Mucilaginibacter sp.]